MIEIQKHPGVVNAKHTIYFNKQLENVTFYCSAPHSVEGTDKPKQKMLLTMFLIIKYDMWLHL